MRAEFKHNCLTFALVRFCRNCFGNNSYDKWVFTSLGLDILERNSSPGLKRWIPRVTLKNNEFYAEETPRGSLPLSTDGDVPLRFEKLTLRGTNFLKKVTLNGTEISKFSQTFLLFSQIFQGALQGTDFSILVFLWPYLGLVKVKKGTLTSGVSPYPFLPKYPRETPQLPLYGWYPLARFKRIKKFILQSVLFILIFLNQHTIDIGFSYMNKWTGGGFFVSSLMSLSRAHTIRSHQFVPSIKCKDPVSTKC